MKFLSAAFVSLAVASSTLAGSIQKSGLTLPDNAQDRQDAVKKIFTTSYDAYRQYAFGHDDLLPVSKGSTDTRNGWGASLVDALSTMVLMGLDDYYEEALDFVNGIDFTVSKGDQEVSVFETTIRYLGGMLSAYELSDQLNGEKHQVLLDKAEILGEKLSHAFNGDSPIPYNGLKFSTDSVDGGGSGIAVAGTLILEWATLSKYTDNSTYLDLTLGAMTHIAQLPAPLPGLAAQGLNPKTGEFTGGFVSWGGGSDSYFEYLIKWARLSNTDDNLFADTWMTAVQTSQEVLARRSTVGNWLYLADYDASDVGNEIRHVSSNLACFHAGNILMGGKLMNNDTIVGFALELNEACWNTYASSTTGIGPDSFGFISDDGDYNGGSGPNDDQKAFAAEHGFYPSSGGEYYYLRPEVLESNFYAYRVTGDEKYLDRAYSAVESFNKYFTTDIAFAGREDVNDPNSEQIDEMESFWFAEVLKYLYLTFDDPSHISLDEWVFNTEAQPFKAPAQKDVYGSGKTISDNTDDFQVESGPAPPTPSPAYRNA